MKTTAKKTEKPTIGAEMGDKLRARANKLTDAERMELRMEAMQLIYGNAIKQVHASRY